MQTFITDFDPEVTAKILDYKRLGKQRVEAVQILHTLLGLSEGWRNHPAVRMWRGYESFLCHRYLTAMMTEWERRGYSNLKCGLHYDHLTQLILKTDVLQPHWFGAEVFTSHKSRLIQKDRGFYKPLFPEVPEDLDYVWPA